MSIETLFYQALATPVADRAAFLDRACAGNLDLRAAVEARLEAAEEEDRALDRRTAQREAETVPQPPPPAPRSASSLNVKVLVAVSLLLFAAAAAGAVGL